MDVNPLDELPKDAPGLASSRRALLVVEDQDNIRFLVVSTLKSHGYDVLEAANGREALGMASRLLPNIGLLITDLHMPGMSGLDVMRLLIASRPEMKVLYLSAEDPEHCLGIPPQQFLAKPFTLKGLIKKVKEVLGEPTETDRRNRRVG